METSTLTKKDLPHLQEYNSRIYPEKKIPAKDYLNFWLSRNDDAFNHFIVIKDDNGEIHGQVFSTEMAYYLRGKLTQSVWGFDLIVDENLRKDNWGLDLLLKYMELFPNSCATGIGPVALPIHKKMGSKMLGEIRKYVGIVNPLYLFSSPFRGNIKMEKFPLTVTVHGKTFRKLSRNEMPDVIKPYNDELFEIARDKEFLQWRYFNDLHSYAFYKDEHTNNFFVLRTTVQKHITVMILVDFRCNMSSANDFEEIYLATKKVMSKLHIGMLIAGSSLKVVDDVLEHHGFKSIGRPRPVMGLVKVKEFKEKINRREFLFTTFADSDGETNWV